MQVWGAGLSLPGLQAPGRRSGRDTAGVVTISDFRTTFDKGSESFPHSYSPRLTEQALSSSSDR